jgi:4-hydroxy-tetrahydrodipicolinate reductase
MGREIKAMAEDLGHEVIAIIDNEDDWIRHAHELPNADVAIEFSMPETAAGNILRCFNAGLPVVSGTTGWAQDLDRVKQACTSGGHTFFYASNFSPGMNMMFELNKKLAALMRKHTSYRVHIEEIHHTNKKDAPSGTAISLAEEIIHYHPTIEKWANNPEPAPEELEIISIRKDQVPGTHIVQYDSDIDSIEIRHTAHSRKGFVSGAILAAEWVLGKKGCFSMANMLYDTE